MLNAQNFGKIGMLTKTQKENLVKDLVEKLAKAKSAIFVDYAGLTVGKITELRRKLKEQGAVLKVVKKTLIDLAFKKANLDDIEAKKMIGQIALILGEDELAPAKISYDFSKSQEQLKILGGILNSNFIDSAEIVELAKIPSRQELLAKLVGSFGSPLSGMVNVLQGNLKNLVYLLSQIDAKRHSEA